MNATKCDRCLKYFEEEIPRIRYARSMTQDYCRQLDICPDCLEKFFDFMRMRETKTEEG